VDANNRQMIFVATGFKVLALVFLLGGILKAVLIGLLRLNPRSLLFLFGDEIGQASLDLGLMHITTQPNDVYQSSSQEVLALIFLALASGVFIAFILFAVGVSVDYIHEVGVEILDLRRIRFEQGQRR